MVGSTTFTMKLKLIFSADFSCPLDQKRDAGEQGLHCWASVIMHNSIWLRGS